MSGDAAGRHALGAEAEHGHVEPAQAACVLRATAGANVPAGPAGRDCRAARCPVSSGEHNRHRLSRAGNRRMNHKIHIAAVTQLRLDTDGRAYYRRKRAEGKKPMEAMSCLKRRIPT